MLRAYKYRIYPTKEQEKFIRENVGANRWFYNYALNKIKKHYEETKEHLSAQYQVARDLPILKRSEDTEWLKNADSSSLIWTSIHLDTAYKNFFRTCKNRKNGTSDNGGEPTFKKKSYTGSYTTDKGIEVFWSDNKVKMPKLKLIDARLHRKFNGLIKQATLSYNTSNQYFISILVNDNTEPLENKEVTYEGTVGLDLGIKNSIVTSDGIKYNTLRTDNIDDAKYRRLCRNLSKKEKGSKNREKARLKLAKFENKIRNRKKAFIDNFTHDITKNNDVCAVCIENLNVKGMVKNHTLAKSIQESSFNDIKTKLQYKSAWNGVKLVEIDRFFPSSKTCSHCGYIKDGLKLNERTWICPNCGERIDRDVNAAINIKNEGYRVLTEAQQ
jgi:putative transposase